MYGVIEKRQAKQGVQADVWFLESLDRINRAIQEATDLEQMMTQVLDTMLLIFDCDRAWLCYPCDPHAPSWQVPMERTKPQYPGGHALGIDFPMDPNVSKVYSANLASQRPLKFLFGHEQHPPESLAEFQIRSFISTAIFPKVDKPWLFGMHQCSYVRVWSPQEERLFEEIGRRLSDALTSLLMFRNLRQNEEKFRCIVETASEGILSVGADGTINFLNSRQATMLGYTVEEMTGKYAGAFVHSDEFDDHRRRMQARENSIGETYERRLVHKDGRTVWALISATPMFNEQNDFKGAFAMVADITERKKAEVALIHAKEEAENAARMKSRFLDIAAHELRTPVTALSVTLEVAQDKIKKGKIPEPETFARLQRQANRLSRLVVELLDVSRLDRGAMTLRKGPVDIVSLVESCIDEFEISASKRFIFKNSQPSIVVIVDQIRIQQVLINLIDNAIKYSGEESPIEIRIDLLPEWIRISVIDQGPGIAEEQRADLFKPFHRGMTDREEKASGLGLGLFVSAGIVKMHGGNIGFHSQTGFGSTFYFDLPRTDYHE